MWARQSGIFSEKGLRLMGSQRLTFFSWWVSCDPESLSWEGLNQQLSLDIISFSDGAVRSRINMFTTQSSLGFICLHKANLRFVGASDPGSRSSWTSMKKGVEKNNQKPKLWKRPSMPNIAFKFLPHALKTTNNAYAYAGPSGKRSSIKIKVLRTNHAKTLRKLSLRALKKQPKPRNRNHVNPWDFFPAAADLAPGIVGQNGS